MIIRNATLISAFTLIAAAAAPAIAQAPAAAPAAEAAAPSAEVAVGARVLDTAGGEVGTITRLDGEHVILRTDKHEARFPVASFSPREDHLVMAMTRDQVNSAVEAASAEAASKLAAGAMVHGSGGGMIGTIDSVDDQFVTVKLGSGTLVRLPRSSVGADANGAVVGMTVAELEAAAAGAPAAEEASAEDATAE